MSTLWGDGGDGETGGTGEAQVDELVLRLTVGRDPELDLELVPYDALASAAHAEMLATIGVFRSFPSGDGLPRRPPVAADWSGMFLELWKDNGDVPVGYRPRVPKRKTPAGCFFNGIANPEQQCERVGVVLDGRLHRIGDPGKVHRSVDLDDGLEVHPELIQLARLEG